MVIQADTRNDHSTGRILRTKRPGDLRHSAKEKAFLPLDPGTKAFALRGTTLIQWRACGWPDTLVATRIVDQAGSTTPVSWTRLRGEFCYRWADLHRVRSRNGPSARCTSRDRVLLLVDAALLFPFQYRTLASDSSFPERLDKYRDGPFERS